MTGLSLPESSPWRGLEILSAVREVLRIDQQQSASDDPNEDVLDKSVTRNEANSDFTLHLSADQIRVLELIETKPDGISFQEICDELDISKAKLQGDLGAITRKAQKNLGSDYEFLVRSNGRYFSKKHSIKLNNANVGNSKYNQRLERIRTKYPNAYKSWSEDEENRLVALWEDGKSVSEIANLMGRGAGGIHSRLEKLGNEVISFEETSNPTSKPDHFDDKNEVVEALEASNLKISVLCEGCDAEIPKARLEAVPGTKLCTSCASAQPYKKKKVAEPWGTREDFKKDRLSWRPWRRR
ncbi:TraR/DksA C4-type zinc finger protein [Ruegeria conchae]|uniref:TraR/DksA C4-type zinc finger protein n=1 Tax=Ruegeria conchae TaxID=981384 RepID=UPI000237ABE4|nr:TraR/DksA C4-type zinc finger protein [Ruegeria conchae]